MTIGMVKAAPSDVKRAIFTLLKKMWHTPDGIEWELSTTRATVIMLWKRKGVPMTWTCTGAFASWQSYVEFWHGSSVLALHVIWKKPNSYRIFNGVFVRAVVPVMRFWC